jgi:glycosyltransferase involved in cell wall biosynthesis
MNVLFEKVYWQLETQQEQENFTLQKVIPPSVKHPRFGGKYALFLKYQFAKHFMYPRKIQKSQGDYFLNSDHSYAHLIKYIPCSNVVSFCHDLIPLEIPELLKSRIEYNLYRHCVNGLSLCKKIITISEFTRDTVLKHLGIPEYKVTVIPLGVSDEFKPLDTEYILQCKQRLRQSRNEKLLLHVGHCAQYKNIEFLLNVLHHLNRSYPGDYRLIKIGGPLKDNQREMIRDYGLSGIITIIPSVSIPELVEYYNICDFLVMPSLIEGQGLPILEAFKCKLPVICSDIPPFRELGRGGAVFLDTEDPDEWARYITRWENPKQDHAELLETGSNIAGDYGWSRCVSKIINVFRELGL